MKEKVNITIANWAGVNTGDDAIFCALSGLIKSKISEKPKIFVLADNDILMKKRYDIVDAVRIFEIHKLRNLLKVVHFLKNSDLVIYGGGDIVGGNLQSISFIALAKMLGLPVMYCGVGAVPIKSKFTKFFVKFVSNRIDLITVRDEKSKELLIKLGVNKPPIKVTGDLAFTLEPAKESKIFDIMEKEDLMDNKIKIALNIRPYEPMYSFYYPKVPIEKTISEVCDYIVEEYNAQIIFIPMVTRERTRDYHKNTESDEESFVKIKENMKHRENIKILQGEYVPEEICGLLGKMDLVISMRLHTLLLASTLNVPLIAINYAPKVKSFMDLIKQNKNCLSIESLDKDKIIDLVDKQLQKNQSKVSPHQIESLKRKSLKNVDCIMEVLNIEKNMIQFYVFLIPAVCITLIWNYSYATIGYLAKIRKVRFL